MRPEYQLFASLPLVHYSVIYGDTVSGHAHAIVDCKLLGDAGNHQAQSRAVFAQHLCQDRENLIITRRCHH